MKTAKRAKGQSGSPLYRKDMWQAALFCFIISPKNGSPAISHNGKSP